MAPKKGKGGKKGKKGGKGKKEKKEESIDKKALANEKIWQARLRTMEITKNDFRSNAQHLAEQNDLLQGQMKQVELDTLDVITFLKTQDQKKNAAIDKLESELKKTNQQQQQEKEALIIDYTDQVNSLQSEIRKKQDDITLMQNELKHVKEFRKKRVAMQRELDDIKDTMFLADKEHREVVARITQRFEDEKVAMQHDTNHKISVLADIAHQQAITNLDETTRSIYKENVRLSEALRFHKQECDRLRKENLEFEQINERVKSEQEQKDASIQERVSNTQQQKYSLQEAEEKVVALEATLNNMVAAFNREQKNIRRFSKVESESSQVEVAKLERLLQLKSVECAKVRKLARNILGQRTDVEVSFLEALQQVKEDVALTRNASVKDVTISDIPWELREVILRRLFTKMNSLTSAAPAIIDQSDEGAARREVQPELMEGEDLTFLTQASVPDTDPALDYNLTEWGGPP